MKRRALSLLTAATLTIGLLAGCSTSGSSDKTSNSSDNTSKYAEEITIDVFDSEANYQGIQSGWFAKIVKDKFNMNLNIVAPNVAGNGDTLFQTRSAAGNLGDLIICNTGNGKLSQLVKSGLVVDMTDLLNDEENLVKYQDAIDSMSEVSGTEKGIYAIPTEVSENSPTTPSVGLEPNYAPYIRWDYYKEIGYPQMENLDDLLGVLELMQTTAREEEGRDDIYAISLFKDWDRNMMTLARNITCMYGYDEAGITLLANDGSEVQSPVQDDSIYETGLQFLFKANQMGLVDPNSSTQNYDTMYQKLQDGSDLFSFWSWMGQGAYNTTENTAEGKGFKMAPVSDLKIGVNGCRYTGNHEIALMIGSSASDPQRIADFIDWLYSPEGIMANQANGTSGTCGPEGLTWELKDDKPVLTEFGKKALSGEEISVPDEWGGGMWSEGVSALNVTLVNSGDTNPVNNAAYMYSLWDSTIQDNATALDEEWTAFTGYTSAIEYLEANNMLEVAPGDSYVAPEEDSQITTLRTMCGDSIKEYSWKLVFAENENEFDSLYSEMQETLDGLKFDELFEYDKTQALNRVQSRKDVVAEFESSAGE